VGTLHQHILVLNDPNLTPRFRHYPRNYAHLYTLRPDVRCILRTRCTCSLEVACAVYGIRVTSSKDVPPKHQSRHAISRFLFIETTNFRTKCVCLSLNRQFAQDAFNDRLFFIYHLLLIVQSVSELSDFDRSYNNCNWRRYFLAKK